MQNKTVKYILFILLVALMFLPLIQQVFPIVNLKPLSGKYEKSVKPKFSNIDWLEGKYQGEIEKYIKENIGYRNFLVRVYNQVCYEFLNTTNVEEVIIGDDGYLYQEGYILAYLGKDYVHESIIEKNIYKLKRIQDTLQKLNKDILIVLAPGKGSFYPEHFPLLYKMQPKELSNYNVYQEALVKNKINTIDFSKWFHSIKDTCPYTLMTKNGIHWSNYSESLVADSLIKYISHQFNVSLPRLKTKKIVESKTPKFNDNDISKTMNLFYELSDLPLYYPELEIVRNKDEKKTIKPIVIADSYFYGMFTMGLINEVMTKGEFWFYFNHIENKRQDGKTKPEELNLKEEVDKKDLIIILATDANLKYLGFGAIDKLYELYFGKDETLSDKQFFYLDQILRNTKWIAFLNKKALIYNKPFDTILKGDIEYLINIDKK